MKKDIATEVIVALVGVGVSLIATKIANVVKQRKLKENPGEILTGDLTVNETKEIFKDEIKEACKEAFKEIMNIGNDEKEVEA